MAFTNVFIVPCLLALIMTLVPTAYSTTCDEFLCNCCRDSAGPLPALSEDEIQARETAYAIIVNFTRSISVEKPDDVTSVHLSYLKAVCPLVFNLDLLQSLDTKNVYPNLDSFGRIVNTSVCSLLLGHSCTEDNHLDKVREYCLSSTLGTISAEFVSTMTKPCISRVKNPDGTTVSLQHRCQAHHQVSFCVFKKLADRDLSCPEPGAAIDCSGCN